MAFYVQIDAQATKDIQIPLQALPSILPNDIVQILPDTSSTSEHDHPQQRTKKPKPLLYKVPSLVQQSDTSQDDDILQQQRIKRSNKSNTIVINPTLAQSFNWLKSRSKVVLSILPKPPPSNVIASHAELYFANIYLGRADMFRLSLSLVNSVLFLNQRIILPGSNARVRVGRLYNQLGKVVPSAYIDDETKIIFRSESARCFVFIEVSEEMWYFEEDGSLLAEKCELFLTELFAQFYTVQPPTSHTVSIILYCRVIYEDNGEGEEDRAPMSRLADGTLYRDFYKVIMDQTVSPLPSIARSVTSEIRKMEKQVLLRTRPNGEQKLAGRIAFAHESNVLEATNLALNSFEEHWIDRDLQRTGLSLLIITAGTSYYQVEKSLLRITTERMLAHGVGLDIISLSKTPLHTVPLFSFRSHEPGLSDEGVSRNLDFAFGKTSTIVSPKNTTSNTTTTTNNFASAASLGLGNRPRSASLRTLPTLSTTTAVRSEAPRLPPDFPSDQRDPLYYDSPRSQQETSIYYAEPLFVFCSFFGIQVDKPHRIDRFMPRARCYELFSQGIGERIPIAIPLLPNPTEQEKEAGENEWSFLSEQEKRMVRRERYDALAVGAKVDLTDMGTWSRASGTSGGSSSGLGSSDILGGGRGNGGVTTASLSEEGSDEAPSLPSEVRRLTSRPIGLRSVTAAAAIPVVATSAAALRINSSDESERGRERGVSDAGRRRVASSTEPDGGRSKTPVARIRRPRSPSIGAASVKTVSSSKTAATTATNSTSATPALIARLTAAVAAPSSASPAPVVAPATSRPSWLGIFNRSSAQPSTSTATATQPIASTAVHKVEAHSHHSKSSSADLDHQMLPSLSDDGTSLTSRRSSHATGTMSETNSSSSPGTGTNTSTTTQTRPTPTQPISISTRTAQTREADRPTHAGVGKKRQPSTGAAGKNFVQVSGNTNSSQFGKTSGGRSVASRLNPSKPGKRSVGLADQARRWASIFIRHSNDQRAVNWVSITRGACLPITTDYLPTSSDLANHYSDYRYAVPTHSTSSSFLLRVDNARRSHVLELMTELISQRLSHGFQICTPANALGALDEVNLATSKTIVDVLHDMNLGEMTAIYLSLANQIHRISYERRTQAIVVKILRRRQTWVKEPYQYGALVWPQGADNYSFSKLHFPYPDMIDPNDWQHLDRLVAGVEKVDLRPSLRYWRTRLVLLPALSIPDREYLINRTPAFQEGEVTDDDIQYQGFLTLMNTIQGIRWVAPGAEREATEVQATTKSAPEWAAEMGEKAVQQANDDSSPGLLNPVQRPSRWLRRMAGGSSSPRESSLSASNVDKDHERDRTPSPRRSSGGTGDRTPTLAPKPTVNMTYSVVLDLDLSKRSDRAERVMCHFDRSHNSQAAYHIELTWLSGSGKIIDSAIQSWTRQVSRWGLNLIEVSTRPVEATHNPFQCASQVRLVVPPPQFTNPALHRHHYEAGLLASLDFFLDIGADDTFPDDVDVQYSYRRSSSRRSQYIHRSGTLLASINGGAEGFTYAPNRIFISHSQLSNLVSPDKIVHDLVELCQDAGRLTKLWEELKPEEVSEEAVVD
ncbi:hypothetical protein T439DRAFT_349523 [Meredithblackwellia eburnea MCA 4105]